MAQKNRYAKPIGTNPAGSVPFAPGVKMDVEPVLPEAEVLGLGKSEGSPEVGVDAKGTSTSPFVGREDMYPGFPVEQVETDLQKAMAIVKELSVCAGDEKYQHLKLRAEALVKELA